MGGLKRFGKMAKEGALGDMAGVKVPIVCSLQYGLLSTNCHVSRSQRSSN